MGEDAWSAAVAGIVNSAKPLHLRPFRWKEFVSRAFSSAGLEHYLDKVGVAGSNPATPTISVRGWTWVRFPIIFPIREPDLVHFGQICNDPFLNVRSLFDRGAAINARPINQQTMKKATLSLTFLLIFSICASAQENKDERDANAAAMQAKTAADTTGKIWTRGGNFQLNMSQVSLTNWAAGGFSSVSGIAQFNGFANRVKGRFAWNNSVAMAYGLLAQDGSRTVKTDDRLELNTKYGYELKKFWYLSALGQFKTQFSEGIDETSGLRISDFMAPGYLILGLGLDYMPSDHFSLFVSPATAKLTFVQNQKLADFGAFGVDAATYDPVTGNRLTAGANMLTEFGGYVKVMYMHDLAKNINFLTKADFFSNYLKDPQNVDVNWETLFTFKVNDWFAATLSTLLIYDDNTQILKTWGEDPTQQYVGKGTQFKEAIGLGISLKL